jgi:hypothetical protein
LRLPIDACEESEGKKSQPPVIASAEPPLRIENARASLRILLVEDHADTAAILVDSCGGWVTT